MIAPEARPTANRADASKSPGPKTPGGKQRPRPEPAKHGLTGEGVALSTEDAAAVEARLAGYLADYRPVTEAGKGLALRAAVLSIRIERCVVREAAAISMNVRAAGADFDEAREDEVDALFELLDADPARACRRLTRMPEGIDRMLDSWAGLLEDLTHEDGGRWTDEHGFFAVHLTGRKSGGIGIARVEALALAVVGDFSLLKRAEGDGLDASGRREWARSELAALMVAEARKLEIRRETLDFEAIEADRAGAAARALFDPSKEATLARRYEAAAERALHRALREIRAIEAEAAGRGAPALLPAPTGMGSFSPATPGRPRSATPTTPEPPIGSHPGSDRGPDPVAMAPGRALSGSR